MKFARRESFRLAAMDLGDLARLAQRPLRRGFVDLARPAKPRGCPDRILKLPRVLEISAATGWQVFLEPDTDQPVSAKFRDQPTGEALRLLLGKLNRATAPDQRPGEILCLSHFDPGGDAVDPPAGQASRPTDPDELVVRLKPGEHRRTGPPTRREGHRADRRPGRAG